MADASWHRPWLKIERDKRYGIGMVPVRIELPYDFPPNMDMVRIAAEPTIQKAIQQFEKLGDGKGHKYQYLPQIPIKFEISEMPTRDQLDRYNKFKTGETLAISALVKPNIVLRALVPFIRPLDEVNMDQLKEEANFLREGAGYVSPEGMPEEYQQYLAEEKPKNDAGTDVPVRPDAGSPASGQPGSAGSSGHIVSARA